MAEIAIRENAELPRDQVLALYRECEWSAASRPDALLQALAGSDCVISAWDQSLLVGLGNAISDGALVVYYPHLLVRPAYRRQGVGRRIMEAFRQRYGAFHQQALLAVSGASVFYESVGFTRAQSVTPMWVYDDSDH